MPTPLPLVLMALRARLRKPDVAEHPLWRGLWRDFFKIPVIPYPATNVNGEGGIRTHGTVTRTTVFETVPFDHSGTSPREEFQAVYVSMGKHK